MYLSVIALALGAFFTLVGILLGPSRDTAVKRTPFESGMPSEGSEFRRYGVRFYMVALTFLIFDVEIVFFYPWAVRFRELGFYGFWAMALFFVILVVGLVYDWKKGALEWE
ncbi:MAG: NADH-quinone oxidoreductase subunit A [Candidatus Lambdaproteobacteria bacterium]|nr:NADH-quinone oxidoreductase subunit A [Candidatus Lambdaproteobacteria bacterium]